jgi:hypothetical protein
VAQFERALAAEFIGTGSLMGALVIASMIASSVAPGHPAAQLLVISSTTAIVLGLLMRTARKFGGGFLSPIAFIAMGLRDRPRHELIPATALFLLVQVAGAICGAWLIGVVFAAVGLETIESTRRASTSYVSEAVAGASVAAVLFLAPGQRRVLLVSLFSGLLYWFTDSAGFGNPAVTLARAIAPASYDMQRTSAGLCAAVQVLAAVAMLAVLVIVYGVNDGRHHESQGGSR